MRRGLRRLVQIVTVAAVLAALAPARAPAREHVGLALGGGAAKGLAHVGVLLWLEEHRVPVDAVAGTSMGGLVGAAYATGMSAADVHDLVAGIDWDELFHPEPPYAATAFRRKEDVRLFPVRLEVGLRHGVRLPCGLDPGHHVGLLLSRLVLPYSDLPSFDALPIPFRCTATDLARGELVVLGDGPLAPALRATMAIPGVFDPVRLDGRLLADGGVLDNVPVRAARAMGADVVIAVKVDAPTSEPLVETIAGLADRALRVMMDAMAERSLAGADVVLVPDLADLPMTEYGRCATFVERGYASASAQAEALERLALSPSAWEEHLSTRRARRRGALPDVAFVEVNGVARPVAARLQHDLRGHIGRTPDPARLEPDLECIVGMGRCGSATYGLVRRDGREGVGVQLVEKQHGPPFVRFAIDVRNEEEDLDLDVAARVTFHDVTTAGSEVRLDGTAGSTPGVAAEFVQPLGLGPVFVAPRVAWRRTRDRLHLGEDLVAAYRRERTGAGADLGLFLGRDAELRAGYEIRSLHSVLRVGDPSLPEPDGREEVARLRATWDGLDRATIPHRGLRAALDAQWFLDAPGAARDFGRATATLTAAHPVRRHDVAFVLLDGGTLGGGTPPWTHTLALGGPFRLAAFARDRFRGRRAALAQLGWLVSVARLPGIAGDRLYAAVLAEAGSAWDGRRDARLQTSGSIGALADTPLGPAFLGAAYGTEGNYRVTFALGKLFP